MCLPSLFCLNLALTELSFSHRVLPFQYEGGLEKVYKDLARGYRFQTWPEELEANRLTGNQFHIGATDGLDFHKVVMGYASNLFDEIYPTAESFEADVDLREMHAYMSRELRAPPEYSMDNLKTIWGEVLFRVTGAHTSIGNAAVYALEPFMINFRLGKREKGVVAGSREVIYALSQIASLTNPAKYPAMSHNWTHVMHDPDSGAYARLKADLAALGEAIDERNKARRFVNRDFHPDVVQISTFS